MAKLEPTSTILSLASCLPEGPKIAVSLPSDLSLSLPPCLSPFFALPLSVPLYLSLHLSLPLHLPLSLPLHLSLPLSLLLFLISSLFLFPWVQLGMVFSRLYCRDVSLV